MSRKLLSELFKGAWDGSTTYGIGDIVNNNGASYACILAHINQEPPSATYWALLAEKGDTGSQGTQGTKGIVWKGEWSAGTYNKDDAVLYQGSAYISTALTTGEPTISSDWELLARRGLYWKGDWSAGTYNENDVVYNDGSSYVATTETAEEPSGTATDWDILALNGEVLGDTSSTDENIAVFDGITGKKIKDGGSKISDKSDIDSPVFTTKIQTPIIELGHASDTTISRTEAGKIEVEGKNVFLGDLEVIPMDVLIHSNDTEKSTSSLTYVKLKEIKVGDIGLELTSIRIKFSIHTTLSWGAYGRIYKNGVAIGTERLTSSDTYVEFTEDLGPFVKDDLIQIYVKTNEVTRAAYVSNLRLCYLLLPKQTLTNQDP